MFINSRMDKLEYSHNEILYNNDRRLTTSVHKYNVKQETHKVQFYLHEYKIKQNQSMQDVVTIGASM